MVFVLHGTQVHQWGWRQGSRGACIDGERIAWLAVFLHRAHPVDEHKLDGIDHHPVVVGLHHPALVRGPVHPQFRIQLVHAGAVVQMQGHQAPHSDGSFFALLS